MEPDHRLSRGNFVRVRLSGDSGEWTEAFVALASDTSPSSVMLFFSGMVRGRGGVIGGALPLTIDYDAETVRSLFGDEYEIELASDGNHERDEGSHGK